MKLRQRDLLKDIKRCPFELICSPSFSFILYTYTFSRQFNKEKKQQNLNLYIYIYICYCCSLKIELLFCSDCPTSRGQAINCLVLCSFRNCANSIETGKSYNIRVGESVQQFMLIFMRKKSAVQRMKEKFLHFIARLLW